MYQKLILSKEEKDLNRAISNGDYVSEFSDAVQVRYSEIARNTLKNIPS